MTIRRRVVTVMAVLLALTVAVAIGAVTGVLQRDDALGVLRQRVEPARETLTMLLTALVDQEVGLRGYVITGDESFLGSYTSGRVIGDEALTRLRVLLDDDAEQRAAVDDLEAAIDRWREHVAEPEVAAMAAGRPDEARALVASAVGREAFNDARQALANVRALVLAQERDLLVGFDRARRQVTAGLLGMVAMAAVMIIAVTALVRASVTRPLAQLSASVESVAHGAIRNPVRVTGPPDIVALGMAVESMRRRLVGELENVVRAREGISQQAPAADTLAAALTPDVLVHDVTGSSWATGAARLPARGVLAGDFYDVRSVDGAVTVAVVDVSGHGAGAVALALHVKHLLAAALDDGRPPGAALDWVAARVGDTGEKFFTAFVAELPAEGDVGRYASAGHPAAFIVGDDAALERLEATGPLAGPLPGRWETATFDLPPGSSLIAYTDGLVEPRDQSGTQYGVERLAAALLRHARLVGAELVDALVDDVRRFSGESFSDDVTVVALSRIAADDVAVHRV